MEEAEELLSKPNRKFQLVKSANKIIESKYKLMIYALQREYEANTGKKGVEQAADYIDATIKALSSSDRIFADADIKLLNKLKEQYINSEGQIDNTKLFESLSPNEKKALELIDKVNQSLAAKALFTSANVRGNRVDLYNYYTHHDVLFNRKADMKEVMEEKEKKFINPTGSTKAGPLIARTLGVKPLNFDIIASTSRGMKETIMDYQMTRPIRQVLKTADKAIKELENDPESTDIQRESAEALKRALEENIRIVFENNFIDQTFFEKGFEKIRKIGYYAALGSIPRAGAELGSNLFYALSTNPLGLKNGITKYGKYAMDPNGVNFLRQIGSSETLKLYDPTALTGKMVDSAVFKKGKTARQNAMNPVMEKLNFVYENIPIIKGLGEATDFIASNIISMPDKAISRPMYFASFAAAFEKETGVSLTEQDLRDIASGESKYLDNKEAITNSRIAADAEVVRMATSVNPFNSILKLQALSTDGSVMRIYKVANGYMARFNLFEFMTAQKAIKALRYNGDISKKQATGLLIGVTARMTAYMALYTTFASLFDSLFGADDEEEIDMQDLLTRQLIGSISTLMFRRGLGNIPNYPISLGIELLNENYGEDLRNNKEYNRFEHSIVFNILGAEDIKDKTTFELALKLLSGPYGPLLQSTERLRKVLVGMTTSKKLETRQKYLDELTERMAIEGAGNLNILPFYKDIRRIIVKKFFADRKKSKTSSSGKSTSYTKEELANLKKYAPQAYRQVKKIMQKQEQLNKKNKR